MGAVYLPTKNNLIKLQNTIKQRKSGQKLLEDKSLILKRKLEEYKTEKEKLQQQLNEVLKHAQEALNKAIVDVGFDELIDISNAIKKDDSISVKYLSVMGVEMPSCIYQEQELEPNYGLYHTTVEVDESIIGFTNLKKVIIRLAEVDDSIIQLKKAIEKNERRSKALKEIIIPKDEDLARKITSTLEEAEREEFTRLKVVKNVSFSDGGWIKILYKLKKNYWHKKKNSLIYLSIGGE